MYRELQYKYVTVAPQPFEKMLHQLLEKLTYSYTPMRLVFFMALSSNDHYLTCLTAIERAVKRRFENSPPVISLVAQQTLDGVGLAVELHEMEILASESLCYKVWHNTPYITLSDASSKRLFLGGVMGNLQHTIATQAEEVFETIRLLFERESMPLHSIVRQWNYIEQITAYTQGRQHYQAFNDARSLFYDRSDWQDGFPAATGIGTQRGGVMIDLNATLSYTGEIHIVPVDNPLQVAAHAYSQQQLLGAADERLRQKTTPKFERAKQVMQHGNGVLYLSGTAAIRGELSLQEVGIEEQTSITIENINMLTGSHALQIIRVYLKNVEELEQAKKVIEHCYPGLPALYLQADVCREELLIEIEGVAVITD